MSDLQTVIQKPALCGGGSIVVWVGIHKGGKTSLVAPDGNVNAFMYLDILENVCLPHQGRIYGNKIRLQDVCPNMAAAVKEFIEAYGPVPVT